MASHTGQGQGRIDRWHPSAHPYPMGGPMSLGLALIIIGLILLLLGY